MSLGREQTDPAAANATTEHLPDGQAQTVSLAGVSNRCANCGAPLASDQRYCVNCGERRGKPRFTLAGPAPETGEATPATRSAGAPRRPRTSASFNLIAGVATLLIAMGVGVLIGHENSSASGKGTTSTQVLSLGSAGSGAAAANTSTAASAGNSGGGSSSKSSSGKSGKAKSKAPAPKVVVQQAQQAASKVTGGNANVAGATATQGSSCSTGQAGCQNGKLTGNYFGQ
jgi:hypothetical protein